MKNARFVLRRRVVEQDVVDHDEELLAPLQLSGHTSAVSITPAAARPVRERKKAPEGACELLKLRAGDEARTRNFQLGKLTLYH